MSEAQVAEGVIDPVLTEKAKEAAKEAAYERIGRDAEQAQLVNALAQAISKSSSEGWLPLTERYRMAAAVLEVLDRRGYLD